MASTADSSLLVAGAAASAASESLDRSKFEESFEVLAIQAPAKQTGTFLKRLKDHLLNLPRRKNVEQAAEKGLNLILLSRTMPDDLADLPEAERSWLREQIDAGCSLTRFTVRLAYEYFSAEEVLVRLLPAGVEIPSSYEQAGHVCHLNLRDSQLPFRFQIAQVILDKNKSLRTVVNKTGKIETEFRTFPMELLAGDPSTIVRLQEHSCTFEFDFRDVYWNSRLQMEHSRLIDSLFLHPDADMEVSRPVLLDATCGVGPFSIPISKHGANILCHANDLNPESVRWLRRNAALNKLSKVMEVPQLPPYDEASDLAPPGDGVAALAVHAPGDARALVRSLHEHRHPVTHAIFNLPAAGIELLDCYRGLDYESQVLPRPIICCYTFSDAKVDSPASDGCVADLLARLAVALGLPADALRFAGGADARNGLPMASPRVAEMLRAAQTPLDDDAGAATAVAVRLVRNVAPSRHMFCVCFQAPSNSALARVRDAEAGALGKRPRLS